MKQNVLKPLVAALALSLSVAAFAAPTAYHYRQYVPGLSAPAGTIQTVPTTPSWVGDGVSKSGACATGSATGCATWNSADGNLTLSSDKLIATCVANGGRGQRATTGKSSGKWYWELSFKQFTGGSTALGAQTPDSSLAYGYIFSPGQYMWWPGSAYLANGAYTSASTSNTWTASGTQAIIGIALDMDAKTIVFSQGDLVLASVPVVQSILTPSGWCASIGNTITANFGQSDFQYPVPAGYNAGLW